MIIDVRYVNHPSRWKWDTDINCSHAISAWLATAEPIIELVVQSREGILHKAQAKTQSRCQAHTGLYIVELVQVRN